MTAPLVSVVMSVFNGEKFLHESIESILGQTFYDFEFIIINDGSLDATPYILRKYESIDSRIKVIQQENKGLISSLNTGCNLARGKYIARMDADDISLPERFQRQLSYLETHSDTGVLGTWVEAIDQNGFAKKEIRLPSSFGAIKFCLMFRNCIFHPTVMFRNDIIAGLGFYRLQALHVEDYDLWVRAIKVTRLENLPEFLLRYRSWDESISVREFQKQQENITTLIMPGMIPPINGETIPLEVLDALRRISADIPIDDIKNPHFLFTLLRDLYQRFKDETPLNSMDIVQINHEICEILSRLGCVLRQTSLLRSFAVYLFIMRLDRKFLLGRVHHLLRRFHAALKTWFLSKTALHTGV